MIAMRLLDHNGNLVEEVTDTPEVCGRIAAEFIADQAEGGLAGSVEFS
jgi:hypothetical protein